VLLNALTTRYLAEAAARRAAPGRLLEVARQQTDLAATSYDGGYLTGCRPTSMVICRGLPHQRPVRPQVSDLADPALRAAE
jgi:hypothetical protein